MDGPYNRFRGMPHAGPCRESKLSRALDEPARPGQRTQQRSLSGSIVAQDDVEPGCSEFPTHAAQRGEASELLDEIVDRNNRDGVSHGSENANSTRGRVYRR